MKQKEVIQYKEQQIDLINNRLRIEKEILNVKTNDLLDLRLLPKDFKEDLRELLIYKLQEQLTYAKQDFQEVSVILQIAGRN